MTTYNVIEKFFSIDGEGPTAGQIATFIRFGGCNLNCSWCDTSYSTPMDIKGTPMTKEEIYEYIKKNGAVNVTLTGGEPLIQPNIDELLIYLSKDETLKIHIETNGSVDIKPFKDKLKASNYPNNVEFILDFKLPHSKMTSLMNLDNLKHVDIQDVYKMVIASKDDLLKAKEIIDQYNLTNKCLVYFSPALGHIEPVEIVDFMKEHTLNKVRLQLQLHKFIWSPDTREV